MYGTAEVRRQKARLNAVFQLLDGSTADIEVSAHLARYLCVRLSGFAEQSLKDLVLAHARAQSAPTMQRFAEQKMRRLWGINASKLRDTLDSLDPAWWPALEAQHPDAIEALQSVGKLRDNIAHGGDSGISMPSARQYRDQIFDLMDALCNLLDPGT